MIVEACKTLSELVLGVPTSSLNFERKYAMVRFQTSVELFEAILAKSVAKGSVCVADDLTFYPSSLRSALPVCSLPMSRLHGLARCPKRGVYG